MFFEGDASSTRTPASEETSTRFASALRPAKTQRSLGIKPGKDEGHRCGDGFGRGAVLLWNYHRLYPLLIVLSFLVAIAHCHCWHNKRTWGLTTTFAEHGRRYPPLGGRGALGARGN